MLSLKLAASNKQCRIDVLMWRLGAEFWMDLLGLCKTERDDGRKWADKLNKKSASDKY
jgi:hypothetical protein